MDSESGEQASGVHMRAYMYSAYPCQTLDVYGCETSTLCP